MPEPRRIDRRSRGIVVDVQIKLRSLREVERGVNAYDSPRTREGFDAMAVDDSVSTKRTSCSVSGSSSPGDARNSGYARCRARTTETSHGRKQD